MIRGNPVVRSTALAAAIFMLAPSSQRAGDAQTAPSKPTPEVQALLAQGRKARMAVQLAEEERAVKSALDIARNAGDLKGQVESLRAYAEIFARTGKREDASKYFQSSVDIAGKTGDKSGQALALAGLGDLVLMLGQSDESKRYIDRAVQLGRESRDPIAEAVGLSRLANWHWFRIEYARTLSLNRDALRLFVSANDRPNIALHKMYIGMNLGAIGERSTAVAFLREALDEFLRLGDEAQAARCRTRLAPAYLIEGETGRAIQEEELALATFIKSGDAYEETGALLELGYAYEYQGDYVKARGYLDRAEKICRSKGYLRPEVSVLMEQAYLDEGQGSLGSALERFQRALDLARRSGDRVQIARVLMFAAHAQLCIGQYRRALQMQQEAHDFYLKAGARVGAAWASFRLGMTYLEMENWPRAHAALRKALPVFQATHDPFGAAYCHRDIGRAYFGTKQFSKSLAELRLALAGARSMKRSRLEADTLNFIARVDIAMGRRQHALVSYRAALRIYTSIGIKDMAADTLGAIAVAEDRAHEGVQAQRHFLEAVELMEQVRSGLGGNTEAKSSMLATSLYVYYDALNYFVRQKQDSEAFALAQKTKARSLIDLLSSGRVELAAGLTNEEKEQEQSLRSRADTLNAAMVREGVENEVGAKKRFAALQSQIKEAESKMQAFTESLYARHPELARKRAAATVTLHDVARFLPSDTALLDYVVLSNKQLALFVVTTGKNGAKVKALTLPIEYKKLAKKTVEFRTACADPRKDYRAASHDLYALLIAPAQQQLKTAKRLVICPDGALWDVPFQALLLPTPRVGGGARGEGRFLSKCFEIAYAYSATGAQAALSPKQARRKPESTLLALANPDFGSSKRFGDIADLPGQRPFDQPSRPFDQPSRPIDVASRTFDSVSRAFDVISRGGRIAPLPGTQREADFLKNDFPGAAIYTGAEAQESVAKREAGKYRYLHFATHGFFNDASPLLSSIVLAQPEVGSKEDGFLTAREIFDMDLSAEMVVLSACNTARGVQRSGDGVIGLTWALFVAGCPTQVVSQWAVDDASTALMMGRFYENLTVRRMGKAAALKEAETWLRKQNPKYSHPYYWAPFVLNGAWN